MAIGACLSDAGKTVRIDGSSGIPVVQSNNGTTDTGTTPGISNSYLAEFSPSYIRTESVGINFSCSVVHVVGMSTAMRPRRHFSTCVSPCVILNGAAARSRPSPVSKPWYQTHPLELAPSSPEATGTIATSSFVPDTRQLAESESSVPYNP